MVGVGVQIYLAPGHAWALWTSKYGAAQNGLIYAGTQFPDSIYSSRNGCYRAAGKRAGPTGPSVLHLEGQNTWIVLHTDGPDAGKGDLIPPPPDEPAVPASCAESERTFARLTRYAYEVIIGVGIALLLAAVLWTAFFVLRWVARGFKSEGTTRH